MTYTLTSHSTVIGHAKPLPFRLEPDQLFLQFLPTPAFDTVRERLETMIRNVENDSPEHPYDAYPELVALDLRLRDETGLIITSGAMSIVVGTGNMESAPDEALLELGIEPIRPLLFLSAKYGQSLEDLEPERHRGRTPQPHAKPKKKKLKRPPIKRHRRKK